LQEYFKQFWKVLVIPIFILFTNTPVPFHNGPFAFGPPQKTKFPYTPKPKMRNSSQRAANGGANGLAVRTRRRRLKGLERNYNKCIRKGVKSSGWIQPSACALLSLFHNSSGTLLNSIPK
jgi:hypothetical protein